MLAFHRWVCRLIILAGSAITCRAYVSDKKTCANSQRCDLVVWLDAWPQLPPEFSPCDFRKLRHHRRAICKNNKGKFSEFPSGFALLLNHCPYVERWIGCLIFVYSATVVSHCAKITRRIPEKSSGHLPISFSYILLQIRWTVRKYHRKCAASSPRRRTLRNGAGYLAEQIHVYSLM